MLKLKFKYLRDFESSIQLKEKETEVLTLISVYRELQLVKETMSIIALHQHLVNRGELHERD